MWLKVMARITVYAFPIITQLSSIPIYSIMIRYNLIENKICNKSKRDCLEMYPTEIVF